MALNGFIVHVYVVVRLLWAERSCGKGRRAVAVTYINATPADVSNGFTFTPPCVLGQVKHCATNVCLHVWFCRTMINIPDGPNMRCKHFLYFLRGYQLRTPLQWFQGRKSWSFLFCNVAKLFWRAMVSLCVYPEDYNLLSSWKQKKDLATPIICSLFLTIKAWRKKYPKTAGWWCTVSFPVTSRCLLPTNHPHLPPPSSPLP